MRLQLTDLRMFYKLSSHDFAVSKSNEDMPRLEECSPRYPQYSSPSDRLKTFWAWPYRKPSNHECVNAGFFFEGPDDLVRCFCCGIGLKDFTESDDPLEEHIKCSPACPYLKLLYATQEPQQRHITFVDQVVLHPQCTELQRNQVSAKPYRHPEKSTIDKRLETFQNPNFKSVISPEHLADAGLYYTGVGDHVRCFACDGGLRNWEVHDDPWTEHCKWFPSCRFARQVKGDAFIENIQQHVRHQNQLTETSNQQYRYPEQTETEARLATFDYFPNRFPINVDDLAQAGLFYTGVRDYVRCFACGLGLKNWKEDSDPLIEHMKWSRTCIFLTDLIGEYATSNLFQKAVTEESVVTFRNTQTNEDHPRLELNGEAQVPGDAICDVIVCTQIEEETLLHDSIESMSQINAKIAENIHLREMITCQACKCSDKDVIFLPCKHWVLCRRCASNKRSCPVCERKVEDMFPGVLMPSEGYILRENGRLKKQLFCQKCKLNNTNALFLPCAHHTLCFECAQSCKKCQICKCEVSDIIKTFMS